MRLKLGVWTYNSTAMATAELKAWSYFILHKICYLYSPRQTQDLFLTRATTEAVGQTTKPFDAQRKLFYASIFKE